MNLISHFQRGDAVAVADRQRVRLPERLLPHLRRGQHEVRGVPPAAARDQLRLQAEDHPAAIRPRQEPGSIAALVEVLTKTIQFVVTWILEKKRHASGWDIF